MKTNSEFVDGVENIAMINGCVRVNFLRLDVKEGISGNTSDPELIRDLVVSQKLVMTAEGFLRCYQAFSKLHSELVRKGIIAEKQGEENIVEAPNPTKLIEKE